MSSPGNPQERLPISLAQLELHSVGLEKLGTVGDEERDVEAQMGLGASMLEGRDLRVDLSVDYEVEGVFEATATYVGVFSPEQDVEIDEQTWRQFAATVAPTVLYPYVRELLSTLIQRTNLPQVIPPVLNFRGMFDPEDVVFEEPVPSETENG